MLMSMLLVAAVIAQKGVPLAPGLCSAPVSANPEASGCCETGQVDLTDGPTEIYWHIQKYGDEATAAPKQSGIDGRLLQAHSRVWL
jgi:hypothetical protein